MSGSVTVGFWAALGRSRVTADAKMLSMTPERAKIDDSTIEDVADVVLKGTSKLPGSISGRVNGARERLWVDEYVSETGIRVPYIIHPPGTAEGSSSFFALVDPFSIDWTGERNARFEFSMGLEASSRLHIGYAMAGWPGQNPVTATSTTTGFAISALGANQKLVLAVCIVSPPGVTGTTPTLDIDLETDVDDTFASPTVRASTSQFTEPAYEVIEIDGDTDPFSDTFFRLSYTIGGTDSPSFQPIVAVAIVTK